MNKREREREREKHPVDNQKLSPVGEKGPLEEGLRGRVLYNNKSPCYAPRWKQTNERERELNKRKHS